MRFAGDYLSNALEGTPVKDKPLVEGFNTEDLQQAPQQLALAPAVVAGLGLINKGVKAYTTFKVGQGLLDGGRVNSGTVKEHTYGIDPRDDRKGGGVLPDLFDGKKESLDGPTLRSPYHQ